MFSKEFLKELGVTDFAYTESLETVSFDHFEKWVKDGHHGELGYLSDHRKNLRKSLKSVFPDCQSAVVFLFDYQGVRKELNQIYKDENYNGLKVASYSVAFGGDDYHKELAHRLNLLGEKLNSRYENLDFKMSLDINCEIERRYV